jgi:nickel transport protein
LGTQGQKSGEPESRKAGFLAFWLSRFLVFCLVCAMSPSYSYAHRMLIDCMAEDGTVLVDVFFPDGKPAKNVKVEVYRSDETLYLSGETDAEGRFSFDAGDETHFRVVATGQLGHRAEQEVSLREAVSVPPEKSEDAASTGSETRRRAPIPLREVFAGFGYIFGAMGILMYLKARSDMKKAKG